MTAAIIYEMTALEAASFIYDAKGKRDPFIPLVGEKRQTVGIEEILSIEDVSLEGVAVGPNGRMIVILNGVMLKEGEKAGGLEIKKISREKVTVIKDGKKYELNLPEG